MTSKNDIQPLTLFLFFLLFHLGKAYLNPGDVDPVHLTGIKRKIQWNASSNPVPTWKEVQLLKNKVLVRPGEYSPLRGSRLSEVEKECEALGLTFAQGLSIRRQLLVSKTMLRAGKLKNKTILNAVIEKFEQKSASVMKMSKELDLPPVCIFRAILSRRVREADRALKSGYLKKDIVKSIINEENLDLMTKFLSQWEIRELKNAKYNDVVGYERQGSVDTPTMWEDAVCSHLRQQGVNFMTEKDLRQANASSTPDCYILDDLYINGKLVRWIEVKSFYASGLKENGYFTALKVANQVKKYESTFGSGAFMFKDGFGQNIKEAFPRTMFLDSEFLTVDNKFQPRGKGT